MTERSGESLISLGFAWPDRGDEAVGFVEVDGEVFVADLVEFDGYPALDADVGWAEVSFWVALDERGLGTGFGWNVDGNVTVVMVIVGEHAEDFFASEESGLAVRELLVGVG